MSYGNFNLQKGDNDGSPCSGTITSPIWGGNTITSSPTTYICATPVDGAAPTIGLPTHVQNMQADLSELGFLMVGTPDGDFGRGTEWAVREFQIYAKMTQVAKVKDSAKNTAGDAFSADSDNTTDENIPNYEKDLAKDAAGTPIEPKTSRYVDSLESVANGSIYTGRISGVVNQATRDAIEHWLENDYRCPVVIEDWNVTNAGDRTTLNKCNLWNKSEGGWSSRAFSVDFSNYYSYPDTRIATDYNVLGKHTGSIWKGLMSDTGASGSPSSQCWDEAEISPERLIDSNITISTLNIPVSNAKKSTFKVVRASAEAECYGHFDSLNAYDKALFSLGPCHWTLGIDASSNGKYKGGELGATLAYFKESYPSAYNHSFGFFGLDVMKNWGSDGSTLKSPDTGGKYSCWIKWHTETGVVKVPNKLKNKVGDSTWFACWHWFFRFALAGRTEKDYWKAQWDMARLRIKGLLETFA